MQTFNKKFNFKISLLLILVAFFFYSCSEDEKKSDNKPKKSSEKKITEFSFKSANNAILATAQLNEVRGVIDESKKTIVVSVTLPQTVPTATVATALKELKASFKVSDKATVKVGATDQKSGDTENDFSKAVVYTVTAEDGSTQDYTVTVELKVLAIAGPGLKRGVRNLGFKYLYYPQDGKIYYAREGHIYKIDLDGKNPQKITSDGLQHGNVEHLLIHNNVIYFNGNKIYSVKTDGTEDKEFSEGDIKMPKIFGSTLYYLSKTGGQDFSLYSVPLDKSSAPKKLVDDCNGCYLDKRNKGDYYVKGNNLYYHKGTDGLWKVDLQTDTSTEISSGKFDNYTFDNDKIYFRYHSEDYSIGEDDYNFTNPKVFFKTDRELDDAFSLNASADGFVCINRQKSGTSQTIDIFFVSKATKAKKVLVSSVIGADLEPRSVIDLKIIGDWIYYLVYNSTDQDYTLHRVTTQGTEKGVVLSKFK